jgi:hypothetical protein
MPSVYGIKRPSPISSAGERLQHCVVVGRPHGRKEGILMRNILFVLSLCVLLFVGCWFGLGQDGLDPQSLVQTYFGVSRAVAFWIIHSVLWTAAACAYWTALKAG